MSNILHTVLKFIKLFFFLWSSFFRHTYNCVSSSNLWNYIIISCHISLLEYSEHEILHITNWAFFFCYSTCQLTMKRSILPFVKKKKNLLIKTILRYVFSINMIKDLCSVCWKTVTWLTISLPVHFNQWPNCPNFPILKIPSHHLFWYRGGNNDRVRLNGDPLCYSYIYIANCAHLNIAYLFSHALWTDTWGRQRVAPSPQGKVVGKWIKFFAYFRKDWRLLRIDLHNFQIT